MKLKFLNSYKVARRIMNGSIIYQNIHNFIIRNPKYAKMLSERI